MVEKRVEWIDMAKGIGLLFVFLGHLKTPFLATWIYTFHMPLFFFLSGLVYNHSVITGMVLPSVLHAW